MGKSRNSGILKQESLIASFASTIRQEETRQWTKISERTGTAPKVERAQVIRVSQYVPNNPLNGSKNWTKAQMAEYKQSLRQKA
jgi:hypothetical protein